MERVNPIRITDKTTGEIYTLDFSRESIAFMDRQGFAMDDSVTQFPVTKIPKLFYYALRAVHKNTISENRANALLEKIGGLTPAMINRLNELYYQAAMSNNVLQDDDDLGKNADVAVEMD